MDIRGDEADRIDNKIDVFGKTFLALTISCARCHDHKFDAISQKDYYALSGFILSSSYRQVRFDSIEQNKKIASELEELRDRHRDAILKALAKLFKPSIERLQKNLLAARKAILAGKPGDTDEVRAWVKHLSVAAKDPSDPFHVWAVLCRVPNEKFDQSLLELHRDREKQLADYDTAMDKFEPIAIPRFFPNRTSASWDPHWVSDEFGSLFPHLGPSAIEWGTSATNPIRGFRDRWFVRLDDIFNGLKVPADTENDQGVLGAKMRYGRILRTPTITLRNNKIFVHAKGRGRIYAAVDSHTLIAGPLHGRLIRDFDTKGKWQWVEQDLSPYKGQRLHLEISSDGDAELCLAVALTGDSTPPTSPFTQTWTSECAGGAKSPSDLAKTNQEIFELVVERLDRGDIEETTFEFVRCANLLLNHSDLFGVKNFDSVTAVAKPLFDEHEKLARSVRHMSRLAPAMFEGSDVDDAVHIRGSSKALGEVVPKRFLEALAGPGPIPRDEGSGRDILAQQMTDPAIDPFIARVYVNRIWHHLFGRGIVASVDNFGVMGERPTHPELLDYLADRFVREGWSTKRLIRELVLSRTYRMSSQGDPAADQADAQNLLLHKARLRRLEGEAIRDAMLAVSGRLDDKMYGKSVPIHLTEFIDGRGKGQSGPLDGDGRRSIYLAVKRNFLSPMLLAFDTPTPFSTMGRRTVSNVPAQALMLMNDPFVHQQAERWADRVLANPGDTHARIRMMYESAFGRLPSADEEEKLSVYVSRLTRRPDGSTLADTDARKVWSDVAHVLFNVKEFIYLP